MDTSRWRAGLGGRMGRWAVGALLLLGLLWALGWWLVPLWLRGAVQEHGTEALGREVRLDEVRLRPWSLELELKGLRVAGPTPDAQPLLQIERVYADLELQSVFRLAPIVDALRVERPRLHLRHLGEGRYDVDDLLERWAQRPQDSGEPMRFGLFNLALTEGELRLDDAAAGTVHELRDLAVAIPFLSNLPAQREVRTEPHIAFVLNGSHFDSRLSSLPFAESTATQAQLRVPDLDLAPYLAYWPKALPVRPRQARVSADLTLVFEQRQTPFVQLQGELAVRDLRVEQVPADGAARPLLDWQELVIALADVRPLERQVHLARLGWRAPAVHLVRGPDGALDTLALFPSERPASPPAEVPADAPAGAPAEPPWSLRVDEIAIQDGTLHWRDDTLQPAWSTQLEALDLSARDLRWPSDAPASLEASARWQKAALKASGQAGADGAEIALDWRDLALEGLAPYVAQALRLPLAGRSQGEAALRWQAGEQPRLALDLKNVSLHDLALGPPKAPTAGWRELRVQDGRVDLLARSADLGQLSLQGPRLAVERDAAGHWMWDTWLAGDPAAAPPVAPAAETAGAAPWRLAWKSLRLDDGAGSLQDAAPATPVRLHWNGLRLRLGPWRSDAAAQAPLSFEASVLGEGQAAVPGTAALEGRLGLPFPGGAGKDTHLDARLRLDRLPAHLLAPYAADRLNIALQRAELTGQLALDLKLADDGLGLAASGELSVDELRALDTSASEPLLNWKSLNLRGLRVAVAPGQPTSVHVAETALSDYFARVDIDPSGRINLQDLVREPAPDPSAAAAPAAPAVAVASTAPARLSFGPISLVRGDVAFSDRFVRPNYSARLSEVTGGLGAFSNHGEAAAAPAQLSLRGWVEGTGTLALQGQLQPLLSPPVMDLRGQVRELELPPLSTYALKYVGHGIERGQLSVDVRYQIEPDGKLNASNQLVLNRLVFGERDAASEAPNLPVRLAVALLADRNGVIDINLPISGSLNDPQFRIGPLIGRLILGLIAKAVTAPFALLGSLLGGDGAENGQIDFVAGTVRLAPGAEARLAAVAKALQERPGLQVTVVGRSEAAERDALQRERLRDAVRAEKRRQLLRAGQGAEAEAEAPEVSAEEYPALLRELYRRADWPRPRNAIGMLKDLPVPEMEALWLAHTPVSDEALAELAQRRGLAVKAGLVAQGLAGSRVFVEAPKAAGAQPGAPSEAPSGTPPAAQSGARAELLLSSP